MDVAERAIRIVASFALIRRVRRDPDVQIMPAAGLDGAYVAT